MCVIWDILTCPGALRTGLLGGEGGNTDVGQKRLKKTLAAQTLN